ncbi:unnamed protein product [Orchesella dallaii]|uniref:Uncharacterized protein n=1 Tax=Orchesella dallaii TaxID=48710 RepID=A0ABP1R4L0_9HEXA
MGARAAPLEVEATDPLLEVTGSLENLTVNSLLQKLSLTYDAIRARDQRNKTFTWLPPLFGHKLQQGPRYYSAGGHGRGLSRGQGFRPR